jgi:hypothetical protein
MKKAGLFLLVLVILGGWAIKDSEAGQWCWQFQDDPNFYLRLSVVRPDPNYPFWSLNGMWYSQGFLVMPLVGTMAKSSDGTRRILTLFGTSTEGFPQSFRGEIDAVTKDGSLYFYDFNAGTTGLLSDLTKVKCSTLPAP